MACAGCLKAKNFLATLGSVASGAYTSGQIRNKTIGDERMKTCVGCDQYSTEYGPEVCKACGCFLEVKAPIVSSKCPKGKWTF